MKISLLLSTLFLVLIIKSVSCNVHLQINEEEKMHYCGSKLTEMLKIVCRGNYYKRNEMDSEIWDYKYLEDYNDNEIDYPYRSKREAMSFIPLRLLRSTKKPLIVQECCEKACAVSELRTYCGISKKY